MPTVPFMRWHYDLHNTVGWVTVDSSLARPQRSDEMAADKQQAQASWTASRPPQGGITDAGKIRLAREANDERRGRGGILGIERFLSSICASLYVLGGQCPEDPRTGRLRCR